MKPAESGDPGPCDWIFPTPIPMIKIFPQPVCLAILTCGLAMLTPVRALPSAPEAAPGALTDESLQQALTDLGYTPKKLSKGFLLSFKREGSWTINLQLVLSPDLSNLGLNANLGLVDEATVTTAQWIALMGANGDIDPSSFYYDQDKKKLYLHRSLDNRAVSPEFLRAQIEAFSANVTKTEKLWAFTK